MTLVPAKGGFWKIFAGISVIAMLATVTTIRLLYQVAYTEQIHNLERAANTLAQLMEAVAQFDAKYSARTHVEGSRGATMSQIAQGLANSAGPGHGQELVVGRMNGDRLQVLQGTGTSDYRFEVAAELVNDGVRGAALFSALAGRSGSGRFVDYRGVPVLAAFAPVPSLEIGIVYKMDLAVMRAPFLRAGAWAVAVYLLMTGLFAAGYRVLTRRMTERLQASEARLASVFMSAPAIMLVRDRDGRVEYVNPFFERLTGWRFDELEGRDWADTVQATRDGARTRPRTGTDAAPEEHEVSTIRTRAGEQRQIEWHHQELRESAGRRQSILSVGIDVTEREQAAVTIAEKEAQLRAIIEGSSDGILLADVETRRFAFANPAMCRMLGVTLDELLAMSMPEIHPPESLPALVPAFEAMARREITTVKGAPLLRKDGEIRSVDISGSMIELNGRPHNVGVFRDTTEQARSEEAVRTSEARLNEAQRVAKVGSWELHLGSGRLHWSDEIYRLFEIDQSKFGATYEAFLNAIHPDDRDAVNAAYTQSLSDRAPYRIVHRLRMPDGRVKHVEEQCETDFAADGTPLESRGTVQDVTERVLAEEAIRRSLREKETLLREIHHRVKNNLQIVSSLLHFQSKKLPDARSLEVFDEARTRLRSMILVHEKLYNSRDLSEVDFADYVRSLVDQLVHSAGDAGRRFRVHVDASPLALPIEQALPCGMVLVELLTNVIKYAFPDGREGEVRVRLCTTGETVQLHVGDDGVGLPADFDPGSARSFGWQLIGNLATQLDGTIAIGRERGTTVTFSFSTATAA